LIVNDARWRRLFRWGSSVGEMEVDVVLRGSGRAVLGGGSEPLIRTASGTRRLESITRPVLVSLERSLAALLARRSRFRCCLDGARDVYDGQPNFNQFQSADSSEQGHAR